MKWSNIKRMIVFLKDGMKELKFFTKAYGICISPFVKFEFLMETQRITLSILIPINPIGFQRTNLPPKSSEEV